jgi:hypothetical protein
MGKDSNFKLKEAREDGENLEEFVKQNCNHHL